MKKKAIFLLGIMLTLTLTACDYDNGNGESSSSSSIPSSTTTANLPDTLVKSYYLSANNPVAEYLQNNRIKEFFDMWFKENIDANAMPQWNYDSLAEVECLDHSFVSFAYEKLYTLTFTTDGGKCGYIIISYIEDGPAIKKWSLHESTPYLYDLNANSEVIAAALQATDIDLPTATATRVEWQDTEKNLGDQIILFEDGKGDKYVYFLGDDNLEIKKQ